jgi:hypothetical protein
MPVPASVSINSELSSKWLKAGQSIPRISDSRPVSMGPESETGSRNFRR